MNQRLEAGRDTGSMLGLDPERLPRVLDRFVEQGTIVGGVLGVANRAGAELMLPFGSVASAERSERVKTDHRFLLTSVTKQLTATQVLQLVEAGELDLEAPVASYLPEFAVNGKERVTTRQLMTHTSGLDLTSNTTQVSHSNFTAGDHIRHAIEAQLSWQPDTWFEYNSPAYWVLAELLTRLTGIHYAELLTGRVTEPLGMDDTRYEIDDDPPERYVPSWGYRSELAESNRKLAYPSGGLVSSTGDLLRFGRCLLNGGTLDGVRILSPRSVALFRRPYVRDVMYRGRKTSWGLSWQLGGPGDLCSEGTLFQWGASGTAMWVDHDAGLSVVLLTNTWLLDWRIYGQIINAVYGCTTER
jgi:CubicO group peptidase (beta-lactamase class C family)